jgi:hypothetical protein
MTFCLTLLQSEPVVWLRNGFLLQSEPIAWSRNGFLLQSEPIVWSRNGFLLQSEPIAWPRNGLLLQSEPIAWSRNGFLLQQEAFWDLQMASCSSRSRSGTSRRSPAPAGVVLGPPDGLLLQQESF